MSATPLSEDDISKKNHTMKEPLTLSGNNKVGGSFDGFSSMGYYNDNNRLGGTPQHR